MTRSNLFSEGSGKQQPLELEGDAADEACVSHMTRTLLRLIPDRQPPPVCPQPVMAEEKERADVPFPRLMLHN